MPSWEEFKPFIVTGLALGGVYGLSGTGLVVLYRTTGVLNLAFGAVGAFGAFIAWEIVENTSMAPGIGYTLCILFGGVVTLVYGLIFGPPLAARDPLVKATATIGLALILLGSMSWIWSDKARSMTLPTSEHYFTVWDIQVTYTQVLALVLGVGITVFTTLFLRYTKLGTAMRGLANDREITATLGVPVRRVEASAWFVSGIIAGAAGLLLSDLVGLDAATLTFPVIISSLAAALIARLGSITWTLVAALIVGVVNAMITPILSISSYRDMTPFVLAIVALLWTARKPSVVVGGRSAG